MLRSVESTLDIIDRYVKSSKAKIEFHKKNAHNASLWSDLFKVIKTAIVASNILTITILTVLDQSAITVTITSSAFVFFNGLIDKLQEGYNFQFISHKHHMAADEYRIIDYNLELALATNENIDLHKLVSDYLVLEQKHHHQSIKNCFTGCCYKG